MANRLCSAFFFKCTSRQPQFLNYTATITLYLVAAPTIRAIFLRLFFKNPVLACFYVYFFFTPHFSRREKNLILLNQTANQKSLFFFLLFIILCWWHANEQVCGLYVVMKYSRTKEPEAWSWNVQNNHLAWGKMDCDLNQVWCVYKLMARDLK